jgi:hypothetical protein
MSVRWHLPFDERRLPARRPQGGDGSGGDAYYYHCRYLSLLRRHTDGMLRSGAEVIRQARQQQLDALQRGLDEYRQADIRQRAARYRAMTPAQIRAELAQMQRTLDRLEG